MLYDDARQFVEIQRYILIDFSASDKRSDYDDDDDDLTHTNRIPTTKATGIYRLYSLQRYDDEPLKKKRLKSGIGFMGSIITE